MKLKVGGPKHMLVPPHQKVEGPWLPAFYATVDMITFMDPNS